MTTTIADEAALLDRLRDGDAQALATVVDRLAPALYGLTHGITGSPADAEGIVQDVLAALARRPAALEPGLSLRTWAFRAAVRAALAGPGARDETPLDRWLPRFLPDGHREGPRAFVTADWSGRSDARLARDGASAVVRDTVDTLAGPDRAILILADVERLPTDEIAAVLDLPIPVVRARRHALHMALRERITRAVARG